MKKNLLITSLILVPATIILLAFTSGPPAGNTGSPIDGQNCTNCHPPGPATAVTNWITTSIPAEGYTPGETYGLTITAQDIVSEKMGFQITSETVSAKAGMFVITDATRTQLTNQTTVSHTSAGTVPVGSPNSWTMDWTAPPDGTGDITFYVAVNATNADGSNGGDMIYVSSLSVPESNVGIAEDLDSRISHIYPNPASDHINFTAPIGSRVNIYDPRGRELISTVVLSANSKIDISSFQTGVYYINILNMGQVANRVFIKK